MVSSNKLYYYR